jgi:NAD(P)-dependent dehydrogenase (short-subunit alcohol dehydrogenase family)
MSTRRDWRYGRQRAQALIDRSDKVKEFRDKIAVVTGGASGIGRAMAERFAAEGMKVVLADIERESLSRAESEMKVGGATVASKVTDVSKLEDVDALARFTLDKFGAVHIVCNNAGVAMGGPLWEHTMKDWEWVFDVNVWGVVHGVRTFVPIMLKQDDECHIVNTASGAGLHVRPFLGVYAASKHAVVALSDALSQEMKMMGKKIGVSVLCPAVVNTRIGEAERNRPPGLTNETESETPPQMQALEQAFRAALAAGMAPADVAEAVLDAIRNDRLFIITHEETKAMVQARMAGILGDS